MPSSVLFAKSYQCPSFTSSIVGKKKFLRRQKVFKASNTESTRPEKAIFWTKFLKVLNNGFNFLCQSDVLWRVLPKSLWCFSGTQGDNLIELNFFEEHPL